MAVDRDLARRFDIAQHAVQIGVEAFHRSGRFGADVEAQHGMVGHDVVGRPAFDLGRVHRHVAMRHRLEPQRQIGGGEQGVTPLLRVAPGVG